MSTFEMIVVFLGGSMIQIHNSSSVKVFILAITLELLSGTEPACHVQLRLMPEILLYHTTLFLWPSAGVLQ